MSQHKLQTVTPLERKAELIIDNTDLPATARALRDLLAKQAHLFVRGCPVKLSPAPAGMPMVSTLGRAGIIIEAHKVCRPVMPDAKGDCHPVPLPYAVADMYLAMRGDWGLRPLSAISLSPLLEVGGCVRAFEGYDAVRELWCANIPTLSLKERPTNDDAKAALRTLRYAFRTFPFADWYESMTTCWPSRLSILIGRPLRMRARSCPGY